ncbi:cell envelope integrity protein TolA [Hoeflea sp. TYP-13]|uniref:cell envelope integrity protein TolA n=1 Tax=Hoeflea sp. TYP-13 TaxID=3230023 RepID=UPI0034C5D483
MTLRMWQFCLALVVSLTIHGAVDMWLSTAEEPIREAGVANAQIAIVGNEMADMIADGEDIDHVAPQIVEAVEAVRTPVVRPAAASEVKAGVVMEQAKAAALPVIAAATTEVHKPVKAQRATDSKAETAQKAEAIPAQKVEQKWREEIKPVETAAIVKALEPKIEPPKKKQARKKGRKGRSSQSAKKGRADGGTSGAEKTAGTKKKRGNKGAAGNAAVSNYPGKVRRKLRRALRYPKKARSAKLSGTALVRFSVSAGGGVTVSGIARSSGSPILDSAALAAVKRAAPFPKIPAAAGRKSWTFTVPLQFTPKFR